METESLESAISLSKNSKFSLSLLKKVLAILSQIGDALDLASIAYIRIHLPLIFSLYIFIFYIFLSLYLYPLFFSLSNLTLAQRPRTHRRSPSRGVSILVKY